MRVVLADGFILHQITFVAVWVFKKTAVGPLDLYLRGKIEKKD